MLFPISRSLSMSRRRTDELGSRLERPIHFECKLNEPMHIGMRLLHPAATDHSVSISRQQVQRIFRFSLRSQASTSFCSWRVNSTSWARSSEDSRAGGTALQRWWFFPCQVDCTHQAALPPVCVARLNSFFPNDWFLGVACAGSQRPAPGASLPEVHEELTGCRRHLLLP